MSNSASLAGLDSEVNCTAANSRLLTSRAVLGYGSISSGALDFTYSPFDTPATASDGVIF